MLLIITNKDDLTADFLITRLIELQKPYFRLNSEDLTDAQLCFTASNKAISRSISLCKKVIDLSDISCVWYRRKLWVQPLNLIRPDQRRFVAGEITNLIEGLVADPHILWVNPMDAVSIAERKVFQIRLAQQLGFAIPRSLISNEPDRLRNFYEENNGKVICKPIFHGLFVSENERAAVYTHRIDYDALINDVQLRACPTYLQEEIPKGSDIRATFIGDDLFSVEIYSKRSKPLDWRRLKEPLAYRSYDLSKEVENLCRLMLNEMRLTFGAFDFVKTAEGDLYFLEVNPTGEWAWLEKEMGFPMRDAFIKLFEI
ncbi:MAG: MvdC/MvdD family ATP grasp protein [Candidatus Hodarchaeota archaeon]